MTKAPPKDARAVAPPSREDRLAKALKENLRRRKAATPAARPTKKPGG